MIDWTEPFAATSPAGLYVLGAVTPDIWFDSGCGAGPRARWDEYGAIEIEGEGYPSREIPKDVSQWGQDIENAASKHGVPAQWVAATIAAESGGKQDAHSWCCYGLMGLLPATASSMAGRKVSADELLNQPSLNIDLGTKLLGQLFVKYGGNPIKIPAAYNAGSPKCGKGKCDVPNRWNLVADCVDGKAIDYSTRVMGFSNDALSRGTGNAPYFGREWPWWKYAVAGISVGLIGVSLFKPELLRAVVR